MDNKVTATASRRWEPLEYDEQGEFWTARLQYPLPDRERVAGLETAVYGPTADACVRETVRQDRLWAEFPLRTGDSQRARARLHYLVGGGGMSVLVSAMVVGAALLAGSAAACVVAGRRPRYVGRHRAMF
ncbi:hypothetical protein GCM10010191_67910 [Actinomadura vinacea]|uniref:Uncharacterized protein n=1 Tax=Actinomadura vinacea TaxID=115336 RepID=A0ABN3JX54_9ACTN